MTKRTAIIDIGSNSARLVLFQQTSRFGFHLVCEQKSRVRIGEGAYAHQGELQEVGMERAYRALESFMQTIHEFKASRVIAVATSALRDAPNRQPFLDKVSRDLGLHIEVIHGKEEALLGAIAANNLLPVTEGITIDIGGGSSDMALIKKGKIIETFSLDLGTVRLKELFFDKGTEIASVKTYIQAILKTLPGSFQASIAIGIGGTARTLAKGIIQKEGYPLNKLHAFCYDFGLQQEYFQEIIGAKRDTLKRLHIKENRHDTVREGTLILSEILTHIGAKQVMTSGVGVREGVYLRHRLRKPPYTLPKNSNPSVRSIRDRFDMLSFPIGNKKEIGHALYRLFSAKLDHPAKYGTLFQILLTLSDIGKILTIYHKDRHASYIAMQELNYGFTHDEMALISLLLYSKPKRGYHKALYKQYKMLLPSKDTVKWLAFLYSLTLILHQNSSKANYTFGLKKGVLSIASDKTLYLATEAIEELKKPEKLKIELSQQKR